MTSMRFATVGATLVVLVFIARTSRAEHCGNPRSHCPPNCSRWTGNEDCSKPVGLCCCGTYNAIGASLQPGEEKVQVKVETPPAPGACYWLAEAKRGDYHRASITPLEPRADRQSRLQCVAVIASGRYSDSSADPNDQVAVETWVKSGFKSAGKRLSMVNLSDKLAGHNWICASDPPTCKGKWCDELKRLLKEEHTEHKKDEEAREACAEARDQLQRELNDATRRVANCREDRDTDRKDWEAAAQTERDACKADAGRLNGALAKCQLDRRAYEERIPARWLRWTALGIAIASSVWAGLEIYNLRSSSNAYENAPAGSADLGTRHIDVIEAKGRLGAASVASVFGWAWYASIAEW